MNQIDTKTELSGLYLWKSLVKDGARWDGDTFSKKWAECLIVPIDEHIEARVAKTLEAYIEGTDYKVERDKEGHISCVWTI